MTGGIEVIQPGIFSTIQDTGRFGFMKFGVPRSGPMDSYAAKLGNLLLQNSQNDAVLEITLSGPHLKFSKPAVIVITGADLFSTVNGIRVENNKIIQISPGDVLSFGKRVKGCRCYLSIKGGFLTEEILDSKSWYDGITPFFRLEKGYKLKYIEAEIDISSHGSQLKINKDYFDSPQIDVFPGPEYYLLPDDLQKTLANTKFTVDNKNNRMAIQLKEMLANSLQPIITGPVVPGTVQLTPSGKLIILMRDCQTTGGYPRIMSLTENGINRLSQKIEGEKVRFKIKPDIPD